MHKLSWIRARNTENHRFLPRRFALIKRMIGDLSSGENELAVVENRTSFGFAVSLIGFLIAMQVSENFPAHSFSAQFSNNDENGMNDRDDDAQENPSKKIHFTSGLQMRRMKMCSFRQRKLWKDRNYSEITHSSPRKGYSPRLKM